MLEKLTEIQINIPGIVDGFIANGAWVIAGLAVSIPIRYAVKCISEWRINRKQNISGRYLTIYEDIVNGVSKSISAPAIIKQKGLTIFGETAFYNKKWVIEGNISQGKFIHGIYYSSVPHDDGRGNIYLEIESSNNNIVDTISGLWCGYDSDNKMITSGHYRFLRIPDFVIVKVTDRNVSEHRGKIIDIAEAQLGKSYITPDDINDDENSIFVACDKKRKVVSGFVLVKLISKIELEQKFPRVNDSAGLRFSDMNKIGYIGSIAVEESFKGRGIGEALMSHAINQLKDKNAERIFMLGWKSDESINIKSLANHFEFGKHSILENYWHEHSESVGYSCPACGLPPCTCSAVLYLK